LAAKTSSGSGATKGQIYNIAPSDAAPLAPCVKGNAQVIFSNARGRGASRVDQGIHGGQGIQGTKGETGQSGISGCQVVTDSNNRPMAFTALSAACPAGRVVVGGVYRLHDGDTVLGLFPTANVALRGGFDRQRCCTPPVVRDPLRNSAR